MLAFLLLAPLAPFTNNGGGGSVVPTNLGLAVGQPAGFSPAPDPLAFGGPRLAFHVLEADQGVDLNGDGDLADAIVHLYDHRTGSIRNTNRQALSRLAFFGGNLVFTVTELAGLADWNGDGDWWDNVLHASDLTTGDTVSLGIATGVAPYPTPAVYGVAGDSLYFHFDEESQGNRDRNGDGDASDWVLQRFGPSRAAVAGGFGVARPAVQQDEAFALYGGVGAVELASEGLAFLVGEFSQGAIDLNGDGDGFDSVLAFHDAKTGRVRISGLQSQPFLDVAGDRVVFRVWEQRQGGLDRNGDGDTDDEVVHLFDTRSGATTNYGIAALSSHWVGDEWVVSLVSEFSQGNEDLNGDGDTFDQVAFFGRYDDPTPASTGYAVLSVGGAGDRIFLSVNEAAQGAQDLNGDGDTFDLILFALDPHTGTVTNLGIALGGLPGSSERLVPLLADELFAGLDFNLDGDQADIVLGVYDDVTGSITNTGLAVFPAGLGTMGLRLEVEGARIAATASEAGSGQDFNLDGDLDDQVPFVWDADAGTLTNTSLAGDFRLGPFFIVLLADEEMQGGADLNGDGDATDEVLHVLSFE